MMGKTHTAQGVGVWLAGCAVATLVGVPVPADVVLAGTVVAAGAAVMPDIDHHSGTVARLAGPVTRGLCRAVATVSAMVWSATGTRLDPPRDDGHRGLTHTVIAGLVAGLLAAAVVAVVPHGQGVMVGALTAIACRAVLPDGWVRVERGAAAWVVGAVAGLYGDHYAGGGWWLGLVVAAGWLVHLGGDCLSVQGVPLWWPLAIRGQRWRMVGLWSPLRIHTGSPAEKVHAVAAVVLAMAGSGWLLVGG